MHSDQRDRTPAEIAIGVKAAFEILDRWGCSTEQQRAILQLSGSSYVSLRSNPNSEQLSAGQVERISYVLNIHSGLRRIFTNQANVYRYMSMHNNNPPFAGRSPLDLVSTGQLDALDEVCRHVNGRGDGFSG
jgi:hypothetical protein